MEKVLRDGGNFVAISPIVCISSSTRTWERALRHTPPRKQEGLGDRLSWVALLTTLPQKAELHIVSQDGDFAGELEREEIHPSLKCEWAKKTAGQ